ncbi:MAG: methylenetetrahydrofolate reductase [Ornithinimicrobium sp.]
MRNKNRHQFIIQMLQSARFEVLPTPSAEESVLAALPLGSTVTVTASPAQGIEATVDLAIRLAGQGYDAVPHLAARMVSGRAELTDIVLRLNEAGVGTIFVPGGDQQPPAGEYGCALDMLQDLTAMGHPAMTVGITGYPEAHPSISDDLTVQAMWDKRKHASHVVSNLTFDPHQVQRWITRMRSRGITLPVLLGVPGPIDRAKLLTMATRIGVGDSTRFLSKHKSIMTRLAAPGGFTGEKFLQGCAQTLAAPEARVTGMHLYTFNQVAATERWRREYLERLGAGLKQPMATAD